MDICDLWKKSIYVYFTEKRYCQFCEFTFFQKIYCDGFINLYNLINFVKFDTKLTRRNMAARFLFHGLFKSFIPQLGCKEFNHDQAACCSLRTDCSLMTLRLPLSKETAMDYEKRNKYKFM